MKQSENNVKIWRAADLHDAEMLRGVYVRHAYPWHSHEEVCLGLVMEGAIHLRTRTHEGIARRGSFVLINAEEMHQGTPATAEGWRCRTIHINPAVIYDLARDLKAFTSARTVVFRGPTFEDASLARNLFELHYRSEHAGSSLDRQTRIVALIVRLLRTHADWTFDAPERSREPLAVRRAREYLDENLSDKVTLDELATVSAMTRFQLLRAFQRTFGLTPHAYQLQARVRKAHTMVRQQASLAEVATATGFADQAHLTRVFKSVMGATPGEFRRAAVIGH